MRAVIAEDLALLRDGLIRLLTAHDVEVVAAIGDGPSVLGALARASTRRCRARRATATDIHQRRAAGSDRGPKAGAGPSDSGALAVRRAALRPRAVVGPAWRRRLPAQGPGDGRGPVRRRSSPSGGRRHGHGSRGGLPAAGQAGQGRALGSAHSAASGRCWRSSPKGGRMPRWPLGSSSPRRRSASTSATSS